jgi:hypothetical protein
MADGERRRDHDGCIDVVPFTMSGRPRHDLGRPRDAGLLAVRRVRVILGVDRDDRRSLSVAGDEGGREPRDAALDREAAPLQNRSHQPGGAMLLHAHLAEIEDGVIQGNEGLIVAVDETDRIGLCGIHDLWRHDVNLHRDATGLDRPFPFLHFAGHEVGEIVGQAPVRRDDRDSGLAQPCLRPSCRGSFRERHSAC